MKPRSAVLSVGRLRLERLLGAESPVFDGVASPARPSLLPLLPVALVARLARLVACAWFGYLLPESPLSDGSRVETAQIACRYFRYGSRLTIAVGAFVSVAFVARLVGRLRLDDRLLVAR